MKQQLKLKDTGSLTNLIFGNNSTIPVVGKGATLIYWSDRHAYEVMSVSDDLKTVVLQQYIPERVDKLGMSDSQQYKYEKLDGNNITIRYQHGAWKITGTTIVFTDEYNKKLEDREFYQQYLLNRENIWEFNGVLKLIDGITRVKKTYNKINVIFGVKDEHYDYSF